MVFLDITVEDELPLTARQSRILDSNNSYLVKYLKIDQDMLNRMKENGCITEFQSSYLKEKRLPEKRNREILDIMKRRSMRCYQQLIDCLRLSNWTCNINAAQMLEHGEGETASQSVSVSCLTEKFFLRKRYFSGCPSVNCDQNDSKVVLSISAIGFWM